MLEKSNSLFYDIIITHKKNGIALFYINIAIPFYIKIDNFNSKEIENNLKWLLDSLPPAFFATSLLISMLSENYFSESPINIIYRYDMIAAFSIACGFISAGFLSIFFIRKPISLGFVNPLSRHEERILTPLYVMVFHIFIFIFLFVSTAVSVSIWYEFFNKAFASIVLGIVTLTIASSTMTLGLNLLGRITTVTTHRR